MGIASRRTLATKAGYDFDHESDMMAQDGDDRMSSGGDGFGGPARDEEIEKGRKDEDGE